MCKCSPKRSVCDTSSIVGKTAHLGVIYEIFGQLQIQNCGYFVKIAAISCP